MSKPFTFDRVVRLIIALGVTAGVIWLTGVLKNVLLPFCLACLISYILEPFVEFNQRLLHTKNRVLSVFITLFDVTAVIAILVYFFLPPLINEMHSMGTLLKDFSMKNFNIPFLPESVTADLESKYDFNTILTQLEHGNNVLFNKGESLIGSVVDFLMHFVEWLLTFIYIIFILIDYNRLGEGFSLMIPEKYRAIVMQIANDIKENMNKYFRSQLLIAAFAALFYCIGFSIVGLPMAIVMGLTVGILYMIPYFQYVTVIPVVFLCFVTSLDGGISFWSMLGKCGLVYVISQCICDYVLTPKIMGKSMGLNPAIILLSLSVWGTLLGIIGMIIALPLTTLCLAYYKKVFIEHIPLTEPTKDLV